MTADRMMSVCHEDGIDASGGCAITEGGSKCASRSKDVTAAPVPTIRCIGLIGALKRLPRVLAGYCKADGGTKCIQSCSYLKYSFPLKSSIPGRRIGFHSTTPIYVCAVLRTEFSEYVLVCIVCMFSMHLIGSHHVSFCNALRLLPLPLPLQLPLPLPLPLSYTTLIIHNNNTYISYYIILNTIDLHCARHDDPIHDNGNGAVRRLATRNDEELSCNNEGSQFVPVGKFGEAEQVQNVLERCGQRPC
jgi:hypothetical protein